MIKENYQMKNKVNREPVLVAASIAGVVELFVLWLLQMGYLNWNSEQVASFNNLIVAALVLLAPAAPIIFGYFARNRVTPVANPRTADGEDAELVKKGQ